MANYSAQGSITIKRLRNGDNFFISLEVTENAPLYQGVDTKTGAASPDWSDPDFSPVITPKITSARGAVIALSFHSWKYNGVQLVFDGAESAGWKTDSSGRFMLRASDGSLKIIDNLAGPANTANDTLQYECQAMSDGMEYHLTKSVDVLIQPLGASGFMGFIIASTEQLTEEEYVCTLSTELRSGGILMGLYHVEWYKDNEQMPEHSGEREISVSRDDVDGTQLFIAEFYRKSPGVVGPSGSPVYRAGVRIIDTLDEFQVVLKITSSNKEVAPGKPVSVAASVVNMRTNSEVNGTDERWSLRVMDPRTWSVKRSVSTNQIVISTDDTDDPGTGESTDVEIHAEVEFS